MSIISELVKSIPPVNLSLEAEARAHLDRLTKPPGSLGRLEDTVVRYCCATDTSKPVFGKKNYFHLCE